MKTLLSFLIATLLLTAGETDITGKWSGSFNMTRANGETKDNNAVLVLKQNGSDITGTVGPNEDEQYPIAKGKIEADHITLEVEHEGATVKFALVLAGDRIKGDAAISHDGENATAKVDVGRAK